MLEAVSTPRPRERPAIDRRMGTLVSKGRV
jgi:hypothetical protein